VSVDRISLEINKQQYQIRYLAYFVVTHCYAKSIFSRFF